MTVRDIFLEYGPLYLEAFGDNIPSHHLKAIQAIGTVQPVRARKPING
jgi:hypothetical protein